MRGKGESNDAAHGFVDAAHTEGASGGAAAHTTDQLVRRWIGVAGTTPFDGPAEYECGARVEVAITAGDEMKAQAKAQAGPGA